MHSIAPWGEVVANFFSDGTLVRSCRFSNGVVNGARDKLLNVMFNSVSAPGTLYIGLIDNATFVALSNSDTITSHGGWTEFTAYTGNRIAWGQGSSSGQQVSNASPLVFTFSGTGTVAGIFVCSLATKGDWSSGGFLWSTALLDAPQPVKSSDTLAITYIVGA